MVSIQFDNCIENTSYRLIIINVNQNRNVIPNCIGKKQNFQTPTCPVNLIFFHIKKQKDIWRIQH